MTDFVALRSLMFAGECFFGASLILALAWLMARNGTASQRHLVWLGAFVAMLILPILAEVLPPGIIVRMAAEPAMAPMMTEVVAVPAAPAAPSIGLADIVTGLFFIWLAGVSAIVARTLAGLFGLFLLHRRSVPHIPDGIDGAKFRDVRWQLRLRTAPGHEGPLTWGIFKSTVLLPKASVRWSRERLEAVLLHEVAHVRRRDSLGRLIALIACAFYWPNPFVWTAAARLRREAEIAADDVVLTSGVRASAYAEQLVGLAREFSHERAVFAGVTMSMAEQSTLKERVHAVLTPTQSRSGATRMDVLKVAALGVAVTAVLALARPCLAEAEDANTKVTITKDMQVVDEPNGRVVAIDDEAPAPAKTRVAPMAPEAPDAPDSIPVPPPEPPAAAMPPAAPAAPRSVHTLRWETPDHVKVMKWEYADHDAARRDSEMRKAQAEIRRATAEVHRALKDAHIRETVEQAMKNADAAIEQAKAIKQADIHRALIEARISETVSRAVERAQADKERAEQRAEEARDRAADAAERAQERAAEAAERARQRAEDRDHQ